MYGAYKALCCVLPFAVLQPVAKKASPFYHYTSTLSFPRKEVFSKKIIQTIRAPMISQDIDLVAGDFNGTALRCRSRDNSVLLMKCSLIVPFLRRRAPHHCEDLDPSRTIGLTYVVFTSTLAFNVLGK